MSASLKGTKYLFFIERALSSALEYVRLMGTRRAPVQKLQLTPIIMATYRTLHYILWLFFTGHLIPDCHTERHSIGHLILIYPLVCFLLCVGTLGGILYGLLYSRIILEGTFVILFCPQGHWGGLVVGVGVGGVGG